MSKREWDRRERWVPAWRSVKKHGSGMGKKLNFSRLDPVGLRRFGHYKEAAILLVRHTPGWTVKDHLKAAAHHSLQAKKYMKRFLKLNEGGEPYSTKFVGNNLFRLSWRHKETARSHRAAAAFLAGKRLASNTRYYKRYA